MHVRFLVTVPFALLAAACTIGATDDSASGQQRVSGGAPAAENAAPAAPEAENAPGAPSVAPGAPAAPAADVGAVFTETNAAAGNVVLSFVRGADGALTPSGSFATGGSGTGKGLGSQGAVTLTEDGRFLLVVDAGSDEITSFAVKGANLEMRSRVSSGGTTPVSVTVHGDLVYVVNAGDINCISGLRMDDKGMLTPIVGSTRSLSAPSVGPAQISFSPKGDSLVVTEKGTNVIDTFVVRADGTPSYGKALPSEGMTPFGFAFSPKSALVVSEAFGGAAGASALSSYLLVGSERDLETRSASVKDNQSAACWVAITPDGKTAFTSNTASANISSYAIAADGTLSLRGDGNAASTGDGSKPIDIALDRAAKHLYSLNAGNNTISAFGVMPDASLTTLPVLTLPAAAVGLAAR